MAAARHACREERGEDAKDVQRMVGVTLYGVLMMARRGEMDMKSVAEMFSRVSGVNLVA